MKNHIAILIGALALCSCEDYLTQENPNKIESEYYFTDESSLEIYTNGFIRSFATAIKSFVDGDKNADTHSWDGQAAYFMDNYSADDATNWTTSNSVAAAFDQLLSRQYAQCGGFGRDPRPLRGRGAFLPRAVLHRQGADLRGGSVVRHVDRRDRPGGALQGSRQP
ncbi:MAG: hypothetical protein ACLSHL_01090 [Alistipes communis]